MANLVEKNPEVILDNIQEIGAAGNRDRRAELRRRDEMEKSEVVGYMFSNYNISCNDSCWLFPLTRALRLMFISFFRRNFAYKRLKTGGLGKRK